MNTGLGIRPELFAEVFQSRPAVGFFEAHSENYFGHSIARQKLLDLRCEYPISLHGVGLSLGRADRLDPHHLAELKQLVNDVNPLFVSEHLAWSAYAHRHLPDLLPLPLNEQALSIFCLHIEQMQECLGRQVLIENPSNYLMFDELQIPEPDFLNSLVQQTGCGLLIDINNIDVSSKNLARDPYAYLASINSNAIQQYHLAGHTSVVRADQTVAIDTHNQAVSQDTWQLYTYALQTHGERATLVEWDSDFPAFSVLLEQCHTADHFREQESTGNTRNIATDSSIARSEHLVTGATNRASQSPMLEQQQAQILDAILFDESQMPGVSGENYQRLWVYKNNTYLALLDYLLELFPGPVGVVGEDYFKQIAREFIRHNPPSKGNLNRYGKELIEYWHGRHEAKDLPYLEDLFALEWMLHNAYFAEDSAALDLANLPQSELLNLPVGLNASVSLLRSKFPIYEIRRQSLAEYKGEVQIDLAQSADRILVFKNAEGVQHQPINSVEYDLIVELQTAGSILQAINNLSHREHDAPEPEKISGALAIVLQTNLLRTTD